MQRLVDTLAIERSGIELAAAPFEHRAVFFVLGVADRLQEVGIAWWATHVLGRAGVGAINAVR